MKKIIALSCAILISAPALADTTATTPAPRADLSFAFDGAENLQAVAMTDAQMSDTEGAALPPVAIYYGVVYGVPAMYAGARWASGNGPQLLHNRIRGYMNR